MDGEIDLQCIFGRVVAARREIAAEHVGRTLGVHGAVREKQLDVIVEAETGEALKIAGQRDANHVRGDGLDLPDGEHTAARLMTHAARRARIGCLRSGGGRG